MSSIHIQKAKLRNFSVLYETFFNVLNKDKSNWTTIQLEQPQYTSRVTFQRALLIHILHKLFARLSAVARNGSVSTLFQTQWNPLVLEVLANDTLLGCVFLARQSENVFQINVVASVRSKPEEWEDFDVFVELKKYVKRLGATRLIVRSTDEEMKKALQLTGFEAAFYDNVLYLDI